MLIVYWSGFSTLIVVYAAVFVGLPLFAWYFAPSRGWTGRLPAAALGLVFFAAWVYINVDGGWVLRVNPPVKGAWGFGTYDAALSADVLFFCVVLWVLSNPVGRWHVQRTAWFVIMLLCVLPLSYYGAFGIDTKNPSIAFPWDTLIALGIGIVAYYAGVASGFNTEELREIVDAAREVRPEQPGVSVPVHRSERPV